MLAPKLFPAKFDVAGIFADQFRFQLGNQAHDGSRAGVGVGFAISRNTSVRIDSDQRRLAVVGDHCRLDVNNLHRFFRHAGECACQTFRSRAGAASDLVVFPAFEADLPINGAFSPWIRTSYWQRARLRTRRPHSGAADNTAATAPLPTASSVRILPTHDVFGLPLSPP